MKKIRIMSGCIGIICVGVIFISVVKYIKMDKIEIDPKKDYFLISEDNTFRDFPYMLGNRLSLLAEDSKMPVAHMGGFCRGFDQFHYSKGYLCYKKTYSSSLLISTMFIDRDRLYVCSLSPKKTIKEIENVDRYVLEGEKLIYEDTKGHLHYYNIKTEEKQEIEWKWKDYWNIAIDNIRWKDRENFYILNDDRKRLFCYSIKDGKAVRIAETEESILGVIPTGESVLLYLESGEIIKYSIPNQESEVLISGINASIYRESEGIWWGQMINSNVIGCPFSIGGDGRLYYDNNLKLYAYDFQEKATEEIVSFGDMEKYRPKDELENDSVYGSYSYVIGKDGIIISKSGNESGKHIVYYDFEGKLKSKKLVKFPQWETNEYARNFAY